MVVDGPRTLDKAEQFPTKVEIFNSDLYTRRRSTRARTIIRNIHHPSSKLSGWLRLGKHLPHRETEEELLYPPQDSTNTHFKFPVHNWEKYGHVVLFLFIFCLFYLKFNSCFFLTCKIWVVFIFISLSRNLYMWHVTNKGILNHESKQLKYVKMHLSCLQQLWWLLSLYLCVELRDNLFEQGFFKPIEPSNVALLDCFYQR